MRTGMKVLTSAYRSILRPKPIYPKRKQQATKLKIQPKKPTFKIPKASNGIMLLKTEIREEQNKRRKMLDRNFNNLVENKMKLAGWEFLEWDLSLPFTSVKQEENIALKLQTTSEVSRSLVKPQLNDSMTENKYLVITDENNHPQLTEDLTYSYYRAINQPNYALHLPTNFQTIYKYKARKLKRKIGERIIGTDGMKSSEIIKLYEQSIKAEIKVHTSEENCLEQAMFNLNQKNLIFKNFIDRRPADKKYSTNKQKNDIFLKSSTKKEGELIEFSKIITGSKKEKNQIKKIPPKVLKLNISGNR